MPEQYKKAMRTMARNTPGGEWVNPYFKETGDFKKFTESLGENLCRRFPLKFKQGTYKRAIYIYNQGKFKDAYKKLYEAFKIDSIKLHFDESYRPNKNEKWMFHRKLYKCLQNYTHEFLPTNKNFGIFFSVGRSQPVLIRF